MPKSLSALQYLDKALAELDALGLSRKDGNPAPIVGLLEQISDLSPENVTAIARTLDQASYFNEVVRDEVKDMKVADRYQKITDSFNSIRDDAKSLIDQYDDGKVNTAERITNLWMKISRGTIADRFDKIRKLYLDVAADTQDQIDRERRILEAYLDFRGALKNSEMLAFDVLKDAEFALESAKEDVNDSVVALESYTEDDKIERSRLELQRDEMLRALEKMDGKYQIAKDLSDNLTISYNTSEVVMGRLSQTKNAKERIYAQSISFFSTNEVVLTALSATFTGLQGLNEGTRTLNAMKDGVNQSLEVLAEIGDDVQIEAIKAGYGPTISAEAVKKLLDSVIDYQERSGRIINEMRTLSTENAEEISSIVEDGKARIARMEQSQAAQSLKQTS